MSMGLVILRRLCSSASISKSISPKKGIVYCSTSTDVYTNLAFEDWAYENWNFNDVHMLLLWRNDASVVIGRHQNPWNECNIPKLHHHNVKLARRKSGGGAVFHDLGNLNISFFTSRKKYARISNLELIITALQNSWPHVDISLSHRDDLMLNKDYKISGSAAKLGRTTAYHHCTLLFDVNTSLLNDILQSHLPGLDSIATESVRSKVKNLKNVDASIDFLSLVNSIGHQFYQQYPAYYANEIYKVNPLQEKNYPNISQLRETLMNWKWIYGSTPKFSIRRDFDDMSVCIYTKYGHVENVEIEPNTDWLDDVTRNEIVHSLQGVRYWHYDLNAALSHLKSTQENNYKQMHLNILINNLCSMTGDHS